MEGHALAPQRTEELESGVICDREYLHETWWFLCVTADWLNHHDVRVFAGVTVEQFEHSKSKLSTLKTDPGNEVKLKIYALFKQVRDVYISHNYIDLFILPYSSSYLHNVPSKAFQFLLSDLKAFLVQTYKVVVVVSSATAEATILAS